MSGARILLTGRNNTNSTYAAACGGVDNTNRDMSSKYESGVKQIPYPQQNVYERLSNLENIEKVKDRIRPTRSTT